MAIESSSAATAAQTPGAAVAGKAAAGRAAPAGAAPGFAGLLGFAAAQDATAGLPATPVKAVESPSENTENVEQNQPLALISSGLADIQIVALPGPLSAAPSPATPSIGAPFLPPADVASTRVASTAVARQVVATVGDAESALGAAPATDHANAQAAAALTGAAATGDDALTSRRAHSDALGVQSLAGAASRPPPFANAVSLTLPTSAESLAPMLTAAAAEVAPPPANRHKGPSGVGGADAVFGVPGPADVWSASPTYAVAQASAVVPEAKLAETVSYWVTQGVQQAELTLDGLGDAPVQVHISLDGDQARVDFRTAQVDLRQAIEGSTSQLKNLLASQGLQLLGLSVGLSQQRQAPGDQGAVRPTRVRQTRVAHVEAVAAAAVRAPSLTVGAALDLFV